ENKEPIEILEGEIRVVNHVHVSEPFLKPVVMDSDRRHFHGEIAAFLRENAYQGYVSVEMGKIEEVSAIDEILAYGKELFG
ncbi:MAG: sugar phosphate isomerase/epimerase, partial [Lachnospiraceae bacterium]|nr:sugar phosphate isomerase/epimerase [Lachnospiraceae bacterium]